MKYKRYKTTLGHKYTMRLCEDEIRERILFRTVDLPECGITPRLHRINLTIIPQIIL